MISKDKVKKFFRGVGIAVCVFVAFGVVSEIMSNWQVIPSYTPVGFMELANKAKAVSKELTFGSEIGSDKMFVANTNSRRRRELFSRPKVCAIGGLESVSRPEQTTGIRCLKGYKRIFSSNESIDEILSSSLLNGWQKTDTTIKQEEWARRNFEVGNSATFSYTNTEGLFLNITFEKDYKKLCGDKVYCTGDSIGKSELYLEVSVYSQYQNF